MNGSQRRKKGHGHGVRRRDTEKKDVWDPSEWAGRKGAEKSRDEKRRPSAKWYEGHATKGKREITSQQGYRKTRTINVGRVFTVGEKKEGGWEATAHFGMAQGGAWNQVKRNMQTTSFKKGGKRVFLGTEQINAVQKDRGVAQLIQKKEWH